MGQGSGGIYALVGATVVASLLAGGFVLGQRVPELGGFHGAKLGMGANAVRARFVDPAPGTWESVPGGAVGDVVLSWHAAQGPANARFEFHEGMLMAVRALVVAGDAEAVRPPLEVSGTIVRTHQAAEPGFERVVILARDCPSHRAEAERLAAGK